MPKKPQSQECGAVSCNGTICSKLIVVSGCHEDNNPTHYGTNLTMNGVEYWDGHALKIDLKSPISVKQGEAIVDFLDSGGSAVTEADKEFTSEELAAIEELENAKVEVSMIKPTR